MVVAKIVKPDLSEILFPTEAVAETYLELVPKATGFHQDFNMVATDEGTYEFYIVTGYQYSTRGEMFSDHLLYESMNVYDTYNKLTVIVLGANPCVGGFNVQDLAYDIILGQENTLDIPFDNGECEFYIEVVDVYGTDLIDYYSPYPEIVFNLPVFSQKTGETDARVVEVTTNAFITIDFSSAGNYENTFFFTDIDTAFYFNVCDTETDVCASPQPYLMMT